MDIYHKNKKINNLAGFILSFFLLFGVTLQAQDAANGKKLFTEKGCAGCHTLETRLVGPPLKGVDERRDKEWLYNFIRHSQDFIKTDADAKALFDEFKILMPNHDLTDAQIDDIIAYTSGKAAEKEAAPAVQKDAEKNTKVASESSKDNPYARLSPDNSNWWWQPIVLLILGFIVYLFAKKKWYFGAIFITIIALFSTAYFLFAYLLQIGVDTGYKPVQPIEFSHKVHAGDNGINCEYCHSSAKHSKTSGIPTANVCMNCHKAITEYKGELYGDHDKAFFDGEIAKVHRAAGWNPKEFAYTGKGEPIKWTRVHNLPDFVYYNHSQHVNVAGLACQTCHGPVEKMNRVEQYSPLTMDWCISCHREKEVNLEGNAYYRATYDKEFREKHKGATVADMGGQECGKCHY